MSLVDTFERAYAALGIESGAHTKAIKRAYRKKTLAHPPDKDPDKFVEIRTAYELLTQPYGRVTDLLERRAPLILPPPMPEIKRSPPLYEVLLRRVAQNLTAEDLLGETLD